MSSINARVPPLRLMAVDTPSDGEIPSYQSSSGDFEWVADASGTPAGSSGQIQYNKAGAFGGSPDFTFSDVGAAIPKLNILSSTSANKAILSPAALTLDGGTGLPIISTTTGDDGLHLTTGTEGITGPSLYLDTVTSPSQALLQNQTTDGTITIRTTSGTGDITLDANGDLHLKADLTLALAAATTASVTSTTTDNDMNFNIIADGAGTPLINLKNDTKEVRLTCEEDDKLYVRGPTSGSRFTFDASSATGGITFPDSTTLVSAEGTAILSTGETGATKFLREDGDGTCSWQAAGGGGLTNIVPTGGTAARNVGISLTNNMHGAAAWTANLQTVYSSTWYARPFYSVSDATLATAKVGVAGAGSAGTTFELAIYDSDASGHPDTLQSTGSIDTASTGITSTTLTADAGGSTSITENTLYWVAWRGSGSPVTKPYINGITDDQAFPLFMGEFAGALTPVVAFTGGTDASAPTSFTTADVAVIDLPMIEGVLT